MSVPDFAGLQQNLWGIHAEMAAWQPDGAAVTNVFYPTGLLQRRSGAREYPVEYTYDYAGRLRTMKTWTNSATGAGTATTVWDYNACRGWLERKRYANVGQGYLGPDYTYTAGGRLKSRTWARAGTGGQRLQTVYSYGFDDQDRDCEHGDLVGIAYLNDPQNTPAVVYTLDRQGRQQMVTQGSAVTWRVFNDLGTPLGEAYSGASPLAGLSLTNGFDPHLRRTALHLRAGGALLAGAAYGYDNASRLQTVTDLAGSSAASATYSYLANSPLVGQIAFKQGTTPRMTTTKAYDLLNRLTDISSASSPSSVVSFGYAYNDANQRVCATLADGSYWVYRYDRLGQVRSGKRYWSDGAPVAGQQFEYAFDDIGNRRETKAGGDENGMNLRAASYSPNLLNQYGQRTVPGAVEIMGVALATSPVTVNGQAACRKGEYFRKELTLNNASGPVWQGVTVSAPGQASVSGNIFVPKTPEQVTYDADGNLLSDGQWNYVWDAENRLIAMAGRTPIGPQISLKFQYDWQGRRIRKQVWGNTTWSGSPTNDLRFVYDGWNLIAELDALAAAPALTLRRTYTWGLDLSGTFQGAGGVGGLLWVTGASGQPSTHFAAYDGNGNVAALVNAQDSTISARYEYGPFGEVIRSTYANPLVRQSLGGSGFRFSTQYTDDETDLVCYLHRYYNPSTGRWLSRDPLVDEAFFANYVAGKSSKEEQWLRERSLDPAYVFCQNAPVIYYDADGCIAPVLIFSVGNAINNGILACYYCSKLNKCLGTARDYSQRAAQGMEPDAYLAWLTAAKPGSECAELAKGCGVSVIKLTCWVGARFLVLRYNVLNPTVK